jgi:hypothetical protein
MLKGTYTRQKYLCIKLKISFTFQSVGGLILFTLMSAALVFPMIRSCYAAVI